MSSPSDTEFHRQPGWHVTCAGDHKMATVKQVLDGGLHRGRTSSYLVLETTGAIDLEKDGVGIVHRVGGQRDEIWAGSVASLLGDSNPVAVISVTRVLAV